MGKASKKSPHEPPDEDALDVEASRDLEEVMDAVASLPQEGTQVMIFRYPPPSPSNPLGGGRPAYVTTMESADFSPQAVQERYGGGRFQYKALVRRQVVQRGEFVIEGPPIYPKLHAEPVPGSAPQPMVHDPVVAIQHLQTTFQSVMTDLVKTVLPLVFQNRAPAFDEDKIWERLERLMAISKGAGSGGLSAQDMLALIRQGMDMAGDGGGGTPWLSIVEKYGDRLLPLAEAVMTQTAKGTLPGKAPMMNPSTTSSPPAVTEQPDPIVLLIRQHGPYLMNLARLGTDPGWVADMIRAQVPDEQWPAFQEWVRQDDSLKKIADLLPGVPHQEGWWVRLKEEISTYVEESGESEESASPGPEPGQGPRGPVSQGNGGPAGRR